MSVDFLTTGLTNHKTVAVTAPLVWDEIFVFTLHFVKRNDLGLDIDGGGVDNVRFVEKNIVKERKEENSACLSLKEIR